MRLEPAVPRSRVQHYTTEPLRSRQLPWSSYICKMMDLCRLLLNTAATCDFQQCGILDKCRLRPACEVPFKLRNSNWCLVSHRIFKRLAVALIRLRICAGWSEPMLVAHTTLLEISLRNMYVTGFIQSYFLWARGHSRQIKIKPVLGRDCINHKIMSQRADSNQFTSVEAICLESTLHHIFRFRTKDKEVKNYVLTLSVFKWTERKCSLAAFYSELVWIHHGKMDLAVKTQIYSKSF